VRGIRPSSARLGLCREISNPTKTPRVPSHYK
jgi:hypothetical protein